MRVRYGGCGRRTAATAVGVAVLLSACTTSPTTPTPTGSTSGSGGSNPSTIATASTTTASETPTALPYPTDVPAAARTHDAAGAEAFVGYYNDVVNLAWTRPQAGLLAPLCVATSKSCTAQEQAAADLVRAHEHYDGPPVTTLSSVSIGQQAGEAIVLYRGHQESRRILDASGSMVFQADAKDVALEFSLQWRDGWLVETIKAVR